MADRAWFQRAVQTRRFAIGDYQIGRASGKASLNFGYPVINERGDVEAVVLAGLDLAWLNRLAAKAQLPEGSALTMTDQNGTILARHPNPGQWIGKSVPEASIVKAILNRGGEGTARASGMDGVRRLYAFTPLDSTAEAGKVYLSVGVPEQVAFADADRTFKRNLLGLGMVAALALTAAWIGGDVFILRRVKALMKITKRLSEGDLSARTGSSDGQGELEQLARAFDRMADALQIRETESRRAEEALRSRYQELQALHEISHAVSSTLDVHAVLDILTKKIDILLPYTAVLVWLRNEESGQLERAVCRNLDEELWKGRKSAGIPALVKEAVNGRVPVVASDVQTDSRTLDPEFYRRHGLLSHLSVPLLAKGEALGVVVFLTRERHDFTNEEIQFLATLTGQAAIAIHNSRLYEQTRKQAVQLEQANRALADFTAMIAHDLRSPLTAVVSEAAMLEDGLYGPVSEEQKRRLAKIQAHSRNLVDLVNDFLDLSKLEAGRVDLVKQEVNLGDLIQDSLDNHLLLAQSKKIALRTCVDPGLPRVIADPRRLGQVLSNLLSNAIKFTPEGGQIDVSAGKNDATGVEVWVKDTGLGISPEEIRSLFEKYAQTRSGQTTKSKGTGLGLAICKMIVDAHGGRIWAESEEGKGTTVRFTIPYAT
ncbi:MAG: GAF domain-containing protein [Deltaproteobacteria bacterium]|nr:GAF domain-containing protein [Deltaproteobacteria bacterium]